ncbi:MAG: PAS domain-containing sensor histidine kinase [Holosporaceae bacterium]|jgi:PAS domain S-box-containing protein|nr:PAS domain-containing sensor histidine kinase [Holosporaceae bacterium]
MLKKIITTLKSTILILACILVPLFLGVKFIKSASEKDYKGCIDTFMTSEGVGLSKYMTVQFEDTLKDLNAITLEMELSSDVSNPKFILEHLRTILKRDKNILCVRVYDETGKFLVSSSNDVVADLTITDELKKMKDTVLYNVEQQDDNSIVMKYMTAKHVEMENNKKAKFFFEMIVKWDQYEKYMRLLKMGTFPRMFYILSPSCKRYVSLNSLPKGATSNVTVVALGLYLAEKINNLPMGLSDKRIESIDFRVFKEKIQMPKVLKGSGFFVIIATNNSALEAVSDHIFSTISAITTILTIILILVCLIICRFYTKTKEQLEIASTITESTPLAIVIFRASDGKIMKINLSATTLLQIERENTATVNMWNLFIGDDDKTYITNAISSNINVLNYEVLVQSFGGGSFWSICSANPIEIDEEKYIVLAMLDIHRRKEIEKKLANNAALLELQITERTADLEQKARELEESNALLEKAKLAADEANSAKSKFLTNMSNELKTPINAIIGYSEILREEALDRKDTVSADDLYKIISSAKHLLLLIDEILNLSTIEAGKTQLFFENVEIVSLIKDIEGIIMPMVANNSNSLFLEYPKDIGVMYSDSTKIRQCLMNLLSNAAKFTELGKITLRAASIVKGGEDFIQFSVIDTGVGIDPGKIDSIFEPFNEGSSRNLSAGLGLSITKKYVEYLGGTISVNSEVGGGSKFVIRVPRVCKTSSNEYIEVKSQEDDEIFEDFENEEPK